MSVFNPVARAIWSRGGDEEPETGLEELERAYKELDLFTHPFERITEEGTDGIGDYVFVDRNYTPNPNRNIGYFRLKPNVKDIICYELTYGESYDLTEMTQETRRLKHNGTYGDFVVSNGAARLIFPETIPNRINADGRIDTSFIPQFCSVPPVAVRLPKHTANNANNSSWISGAPGTSVTEHIVVAPKGMDAPVHLHKFHLMSVDTIVAILENLADVRDRDNPPTLTLGVTNLAKLTEEQIAIAEEKGWNLA